MPNFQLHIFALDYYAKIRLRLSITVLEKKNWKLIFAKKWSKTYLSCANAWCAKPSVLCCSLRSHKWILFSNVAATSLFISISKISYSQPNVKFLTHSIKLKPANSIIDICTPLEFHIFQIEHFYIAIIKASSDHSF